MADVFKPQGDYEFRKRTSPAEERKLREAEARKRRRDERLARIRKESRR